MFLSDTAIRKPVTTLLLSGFIRKPMNGVILDLFLGAMLTSVVILLFLSSYRMTLISVGALPTSVIASFVLIYVLDFTINNMTVLETSEVSAPFRTKTKLKFCIHRG